MKKLSFLFCSVILLGLTAATAVARDHDEAIVYTQLPQTARTFLETNFKGEQTVSIVRDVDGRSVEYEVKLTEGKEIKFYESGEWKEVDCKYHAVPAAIVPSQIASAVNSQYPGVAIVKIEKHKKTWEVELNNDVEIEFYNDFTIKKMDR